MMMMMMMMMMSFYEHRNEPSVFMREGQFLIVWAPVNFLMKTA
jgi:hypothetical protein